LARLEDCEPEQEDCEPEQGDCDYDWQASTIFTYLSPSFQGGPSL
jgi:hypothetical protein